MWAGDIGSPLIGGGLNAIQVAYLRLRGVSPTTAAQLRSSTSCGPRCSTTGPRVRNPQSPLSILSEADFGFIDLFFSEVRRALNRNYGTGGHVPNGGSAPHPPEPLAIQSA
jgi:hypothetical protein